MQSNPNTTSQLIGLCLLLPPSSLTSIVQWHAAEYPGADKAGPKELLKHPLVKGLDLENVHEVPLTVDDTRDECLVDFVVFMNRDERSWLMRLRSMDWRKVDVGREAAELFHDGFVHRIPGRVMYALVKGSLVHQGCEVPRFLNKKMAGARMTVEKHRKTVRSDQLSPDVPPISQTRKLPSDPEGA